jgi:hypothetical protein
MLTLHISSCFRFTSSLCPAYGILSHFFCPLSSIVQVLLSIPQVDAALLHWTPLIHQDIPKRDKWSFKSKRPITVMDTTGADGNAS